MAKPTSELTYTVNGTDLVGAERSEAADLEPDDLLRLAAGEAIRHLRRFMAQPERTESERVDFKNFLGIVSSWTRYESHRGAARALDFQMARDLAENKEELRRYIRLTHPSHPLVPALPK